MSDANGEKEPASPWWQWSLKELMVAIGFAAIFVAMMTYMGVSNVFFWTCAIVSLIITGACVVFLPRGRYAIPRIIVLVVMLLLCNPLLMFFSGVIAINGLLHFVLMFCAKAQAECWSVKRVLFWSVSITLVAFAAGILIGYPKYREFQSDKSQIQLVDLSARLRYESEGTAAETDRAESVDQAGAGIPGEEDFENRSGVASRERFFGRAWALRNLHSGRVEVFVKSFGFGIGRFFVPSPEHADYPVLRDFDFDVLPSEEFKQLDSYVHRYDSWSDRINGKKSLHLEGVMNFADPESWGYTVEPGLVFGFRPHGFTLPLQNMGQSYLRRAKLKLGRLQLVSSHRFESPRAYVLDHLPRMDQLTSDDVPTRELTDFEITSLKQLEDADDLVRYQSTPDDGLEMVGAIRAYPSCLECHNVRRGDLLGAFTYRFDKALYASDGPKASQ